MIVTLSVHVVVFIVGRGEVRMVNSVINSRRTKIGDISEISVKAIKATTYRGSYVEVARVQEHGRPFFEPLSISVNAIYSSIYIDMIPVNVLRGRRAILWKVI